MAQQILKVVDGSFKSFFGLLKKAKQGKHALKDCRLPRYLPKEAYVDIGITLPAMWLELLKALVLSNYLKRTRSLKSSMQDVELYGQGGDLVPTVGHISEATVIKYIEEQKNDK